MSEQNTNVNYNAVVNFKDFHVEADALLAKIKAIKQAEKDLNQQRTRTTNTGAAKSADPARAAKSQEANDNRRIKRLDAAQRITERRDLRHQKSLDKAQNRRERKALQAEKEVKSVSDEKLKDEETAGKARRIKELQHARNLAGLEKILNKAADAAQARRIKADAAAQDARLKNEAHEKELVRRAEKAQQAEDHKADAEAAAIQRRLNLQAEREAASIRSESLRHEARQRLLMAKDQEVKDKQKAQETLARLNAARAELGTTNQEARDGNKFTRRPIQERSVGQVKVNYDADKDANYYQAVTRAREQELRMVERSTQAVNREMEARGALFNILRKIPAAARDAGNSTSGSFRNTQRDIRRTNGLLGNVVKNLDQIGRWRPRLIPPFIALVPIIASLLALINPLVAGLGAVGGAAIGLAGSIGSLAGAALGAIPALASLLSVGSALKAVFGGVGKALKAAGKANGGTGAPGTGGSPVPGSPKAPKLADQIKLEELTHVEKIQRAQENYRRSIEDVTEAQLALTEAKDEYFERLQDIQKQIKRNALEERRAAANVQLAEENYWNTMADSGSTKGQKMDAAVSLDEAKQEAKGTTAEIKELRKELDEMRRGGVGADPAVRRATRAVTDAVWAQRDAQIELANAYKGTEIAAAEQADAANAAAYEAAEAAGATDEFAEAMSKLSPSAQAVVLALLAMQPAWEAVRKSVQERFFSEIIEDIQLLVRLFPVLETLLGNTAGALGRVASRGLRLVTSDKWLRDLNILAEQNVPLIENVGDGLLEILDMMMDLAIAAGPFYTALTEGFKEGSKNLGDMVAHARETGSLANWLEIVRGRLAQWWRIIKNIGVTLFNYSAAAAPFGQWMTDGMEAMTKAWRAASEEAREAGSPFQTWLEDIKPALTEVRELFATFFKWFGREASNSNNIEQFTRIIDTITNELGPALARIFDSLTETGVGESLLDAIVQILETIAKFLERGGAEGIKQFFDTINDLFALLADAVDRVPPDVLAGIASTLATIAALRFVGVTSFIGSLIKLAGAAGLARLVSLFKNMSKIPKTLPTTPAPGGGTNAPGGVVAGSSSGKAAGALKALGAGLVASLAFSVALELWKYFFPEVGKASFGPGSSRGMPTSVSTGVPEKIQPGIFKFFTEGDGKKFGSAMSASFLLLFPSLAKLLRGKEEPSSGGGGGRTGIRAGAPIKIPAIDTKTGSVWGDFFGDPLTWLNEKWSGVMSWFGERAAEILAPILIIGTAVSVGWKLIWDGIVSTVQTAYETYIAPIVNGIQTLFGLLGTAMMLTYALVIKPALDNVGKAFNFLKTNFVDPAMNGINRLISNIVLFGIIPILATLSAYVRTKPAEAFEAAKNGIRDAWNGIKELAKVPVRFVVDVVLGGLRTALNKIEGVNIPEIRLPAGFHDGGYTGNKPARQAVGVVHGDEHVIRAQSRQKIERSNPGLLDHMNTFGEVPGYKKGGLVNPLPAGSYSVSQPYKGAAHNGIDLAAASGTKVYATGEGTVQMAQSVNMGGNEVYIQHDNGLGTRYSHLSGFASRPGDKVKPGNIIGYVGSTGMALDVTTPVLTANRGWVEHGELVPGDVVFDENGAQQDVLHSQHWGLRPTYRVTFDDGTYIDADENHLWSVYDYKEERKGNTGLVVRDTKFLAGTAVYGVSKKYTRYAVPVAGAVEFPTADLRIDPYALGVWLGDGHAASARISVGSQDVEATRRNLEFVGEDSKVRPDNNGNFTLTLIGKGVPEGAYNSKTGTNQHPEAFSSRLGLLGVKHNKHIPAEYMQGSAAQRLALLQGLLDTDGYVDPRQGTVEFVQAGKHKELALQVYELVLSLGFKATITTGKAKYAGAVNSTKYRITFTPDIVTFRLPRKVKAQTEAISKRTDRAKKRITHRFIQSVNLIASVATNCITVSGESHLYLAGLEMVPTHNSTGPHLHYMVHNPGGGPGNYGNHQDPAGWMNGNAQELGEAWNPLQGMADFVTNKIAARFPGGGMWVNAAAGLMKQGADQAIRAYTPKIGTDNSRRSGHTLFDKGGWWNGEEKPVSKLNQPEAILTTPQWESMHNLSNLMSQAFGGVGASRVTGSTFAGSATSMLGSNVSTDRSVDKRIVINELTINNPVGETTNDSIANTIRDAAYLRG